MLEYNGIEIKVIPEALDVATTSAKLSEMKITSDQRATNRVVYNNAFGQGTKLIYTPAFSGYKEDIIIERYNGCTRYSFIVYSNGLELNGRRLYDENGNDVGGFSDVLVFDANGKKFSGEIEIEMLEERKKYRVIYVLPERELENATYPIDIDPSLVIQTFDDENNKDIIDRTVVYANRSVLRQCDIGNCITRRNRPYPSKRSIWKRGFLISGAL